MEGKERDLLIKRLIFGFLPIGFKGILPETIKSLEGELIVAIDSKFKEPFLGRAKYIDKQQYEMHSNKKSNLLDYSNIESLFCLNPPDDY